MKKLSVVLMTGIMAASMAAAAYAKDEPAGKFEKIGIHMTLPEEMSEVKGVFDPEFYGAISDDPEIYYMGVAYFAMPQEKLEYYQNLPEEDFTEEVSEEISGLQTLICEIFAVQGDSGDFYKMLGMEENTEEIGLEELGKSDEFTFFCIPTDGAQYLTNADDSFIEEYQTVYDMTMNALRNAAFEDPSTSFAGKTAAFKSTDLDGREVSSDELAAFCRLYHLSADYLTGVEQLPSNQLVFARSFSELSNEDQQEIINLIAFKREMATRQERR